METVILLLLLLLLLKVLFDPSFWRPRQSWKPGEDPFAKSPYKHYPDEQNKERKGH